MLLAHLVQRAWQRTLTNQAVSPNCSAQDVLLLSAARLTVQLCLAAAAPTTRGAAGAPMQPNHKQVSVVGGAQCTEM